MIYDPKIHSISLDYEGKDIVTLLDKVSYISPIDHKTKVTMILVGIYINGEGKYRCGMDNSDEIYADEILNHYKTKK